MELLIAGAIGLLGYQLSRGEESHEVVVAQTQPPRTVTVQDARNEEKARAEASFVATADPKRTGVIVPPNTQPYFRSARSQNTSDSMKSRLFDLFTGTLDVDSGSATGTWRKKEESKARFQPLPQPVTSGGSSGNPVCWERRMPVPSLIQNNVLPATQERVGPGVCVGADVPASDGFHPMCRILPKNVGDYKKTHLEGRINMGGAQNAMRPADPSVTQNRPPRVWDMNRRPPEATMAAVTARTHRPEIGLKCVDDRPHEEDYFGHPAQANGPVPPSDSSREDTRNRSDLHYGLPLTNVTGARHGVGGFTVESYETGRIDSQQRESAGFQGMITGDQRRGMAPSGHVVPPTMRELTTSRSEHYMGGVGHMVPSGDTRPMDMNRTTLRQLTSGPADTGGAAPILKGPTVQCTYKQLNKPAKRYATTGFVPQAQRTTEYRRANVGNDDPWQVAGICKGKWVALKERNEANRQMAHGASSSMYFNMAPVGQSAVANNKLPEVNTRQDFGLVGDVLAKNEFALSIT